ncbi:MAG: tetratricopeptide repeat protein [Azonexus sp.]
MSLLMDALKRAETSKQEAARNLSGKPLSPSELLSLEPLPDEPGRATANPLPKLAAHIDTVDADLAGAAMPGSRAAPPTIKTSPSPKPVESREAVRNAFAVKQVPEESPSRLPLWLTLGILGIGGIGIGGYVWYQMNSMNHGTMVASPGTAAQTPPAQMPKPPVPAVPLNTPSDFGSENRLTAAIAPQPTTTPLFPRQSARPSSTQASDTETPGNPPIRLVRTHPEPDTNLVRGYASLQRGEIELSRRELEQALRRDPNNTDTLLALAAIAHRQGRLADAGSLRQRALFANPSDPAAQAASLNNAAADADPNAAESRLKTLLSTQPESPPLNFALGNLYSRQGRWSEAQQAYFNSVAADGDNPDYLLNLAVSLDHMRQPRLAAQHYRLALEAAAKRPAGFDRDKVRMRLGELQPERQP